jgi:uncharacterized SAM-dependent methyltransferase
VTALQGRKEIPLKFQYLGGGAKLFSKIRQSNYPPFKAERRLLNKHAKLIASKLRGKTANVVYPACGTGEKIFPLMKELIAKQKQSPVHFALLDISPEMLAIAKRKMRSRLKTRVKLRTDIVDLEHGNFAHVTNDLRKNAGEVNLIVLDGNMLGQQHDKARILGNLRDSMTSEDFLLLGVHIVGRKSRINVLQEHQEGPVADFFSHVLENIGVSREAGQFVAFKNRQRNQLEWRFVFNQDVAIKLYGEQVRFEKGSKLLLGTSHKFEAPELRKMLNYAGFNEKLWLQDKTKEYALVLAQPKQL